MRYLIAVLLTVAIGLEIAPTIRNHVTELIAQEKRIMFSESVYRANERHCSKHPRRNYCVTKS